MRPCCGRRIISSLILFFFACSNLQLPAAEMVGGGMVLQPSTPRGMEKSLLDVVHISPKWGNIVRRYEGSSDRTVILIQDAHCNFEAQSNTARILSELFKGRDPEDIPVINVEGASGVLDTSFLTAFPDPKLKKRTALYYLRRGKISGAEYLSMIQKEPLPIHGVENLPLYFQNLHWFDSSLGFRTQAQAILKNLSHFLDVLKSKIFSQELNEFLKAREAYQKNEKSLESYMVFLKTVSKEKNVSITGLKNIEILLTTREEEKALDFAGVEKETSQLIEKAIPFLNELDSARLVTQNLYLKLGRITPYEYFSYFAELLRQHEILDESYRNFTRYVDYLERFHRVDEAMLLLELDQWARRVETRFLRNEEERQLSFLLERLSFYEKFYSLELNRDEWALYQDEKGQISTRPFVEFLQKMTPKYGLVSADLSGINFLDEHLSQLEKFYEAAVVREDVMVENALKALQSPVSSLRSPGTVNKNIQPVTGASRQVTVLITGGFHTDGIARELREKGISYVVISPKITDFEDKSPYLSVMQDERDVLEEVFVRTIDNRRQKSEVRSQKTGEKRRETGNAKRETGHDSRLFSYLATLSPLQNRASLAELLTNPNLDSDLVKRKLESADLFELVSSAVLKIMVAALPIQNWDQLLAEWKKRLSERMLSEAQRRNFLKGVSEVEVSGIEEFDGTFYISLKVEKTIFGAVVNEGAFDDEEDVSHSSVISFLNSEDFQSVVQELPKKKLEKILQGKYSPDDFSDTFRRALLQYPDRAELLINRGYDLRDFDFSARWKYFRGENFHGKLKAISDLGLASDVDFFQYSPAMLREKVGQLRKTGVAVAVPDLRVGRGVFETAVNQFVEAELAFERWTKEGRWVDLESVEALYEGLLKMNVRGALQVRVQARKQQLAESRTFYERFQPLKGEVQRLFRQNELDQAIMIMDQIITDSKVTIIPGKNASIEKMEQQKKALVEKAVHESLPQLVDAARQLSLEASLLIQGVNEKRKYSADAKGVSPSLLPTASSLLKAAEAIWLNSDDEAFMEAYAPEDVALGSDFMRAYDEIRAVVGDVSHPLTLLAWSKNNTVSLEMMERESQRMLDLQRKRLEQERARAAAIAGLGILLNLAQSFAERGTRERNLERLKIASEMYDELLGAMRSLGVDAVRGGGDQELSLSTLYERQIAVDRLIAEIQLQVAQEAQRARMASPLESTIARPARVIKPSSVATARDSGKGVTARSFKRESVEDPRKREVTQRIKRSRKRFFWTYERMVAAAVAAFISLGTGLFFFVDWLKNESRRPVPAVVSPAPMARAPAPATKTLAEETQVPRPKVRPEAVRVEVTPPVSSPVPQLEGLTQKGRILRWQAVPGAKTYTIRIQNNSGHWGILGIVEGEEAPFYRIPKGVKRIQVEAQMGPGHTNPKAEITIRTVKKAVASAPATPLDRMKVRSRNPVDAMRYFIGARPKKSPSNPTDYFRAPLRTGFSRGVEREVGYGVLRGTTFKLDPKNEIFLNEEVRADYESKINAALRLLGLYRDLSDVSLPVVLVEDLDTWMDFSHDDKVLRIDTDALSEENYSPDALARLLRHEISHVQGANEGVAVKGDLKLHGEMVKKGSQVPEFLRKKHPYFAFLEKYYGRSERVQRLAVRSFLWRLDLARSLTTLGMTLRARLLPPDQVRGRNDVIHVAGTILTSIVVAVALVLLPGGPATAAEGAAKAGKAASVNMNDRIERGYKLNLSRPIEEDQVLVVRTCGAANCQEEQGVSDYYIYLHSGTHLWLTRSQGHRWIRLALFEIIGFDTSGKAVTRPVTRWTRSMRVNLNVPSPALEPGNLRFNPATRILRWDRIPDVRGYEVLGFDNSRSDDAETPEDERWISLGEVPQAKTGTTVSFEIRRPHLSKVRVRGVRGEKGGEIRGAVGEIPLPPYEISKPAPRIEPQAKDGALPQSEARAGQEQVSQTAGVLRFSWGESFSPPSRDKLAPRDALFEMGPRDLTMLLYIPPFGDKVRLEAYFREYPYTSSGKRYLAQWAGLNLGANIPFDIQNYGVSGFVEPQLGLLRSPLATPGTLARIGYGAVVSEDLTQDSTLEVGVDGEGRLISMKEVSLDYDTRSTVPFEGYPYYGVVGRWTSDLLYPRLTANPRVMAFYNFGQGSFWGREGAFKVGLGGRYEYELANPVAHAVLGAAQADIPGFSVSLQGGNYWSPHFEGGSSPLARWSLVWIPVDPFQLTWVGYYQFRDGEITTTLEPRYHMSDRMDLFAELYWWDSKDQPNAPIPYDVGPYDVRIRAGLEWRFRAPLDTGKESDQEKILDFGTWANDRMSFNQRVEGLPALEDYVRMDYEDKINEALEFLSRYVDLAGLSLPLMISEDLDTWTNFDHATDEGAWSAFGFERGRLLIDTDALKDENYSKEALAVLLNHERAHALGADEIGAILSDLALVKKMKLKNKNFRFPDSLKQHHAYFRFLESLYDKKPQSQISAIHLFLTTNRFVARGRVVLRMSDREALEFAHRLQAEMDLEMALSKAPGLFEKMDRSTFYRLLMKELGDFLEEDVIEDREPLVHRIKNLVEEMAKGNMRLDQFMREVKAFVDGGEKRQAGGLEDQVHFQKIQGMAMAFLFVAGMLRGRRLRADVLNQVIEAYLKDEVFKDEKMAIHMASLTLDNLFWISDKKDRKDDSVVPKLSGYRGSKVAELFRALAQLQVQWPAFALGEFTDTEQHAKYEEEKDLARQFRGKILRVDALGRHGSLSVGGQTINVSIPVREKLKELHDAVNRGLPVRSPVYIDFIGSGYVHPARIMKILKAIILDPQKVRGGLMIEGFMGRDEKGNRNYLDGAVAKVWVESNIIRVQVQSLEERYQELRNRLMGRISARMKNTAFSQALVLSGGTLGVTVEKDPLGKVGVRSRSHEFRGLYQYARATGGEEGHKLKLAVSVVLPKGISRAEVSEELILRALWPGDDFEAMKEELGRGVYIRIFDEVDLEALNTKLHRTLAQQLRLEVWERFFQTLKAEPDRLIRFVVSREEQELYGDLSQYLYWIVEGTLDQKKLLLIAEALASDGKILDSELVEFLKKADPEAIAELNNHRIMSPKGSFEEFDLRIRAERQTATMA